MLLRFGVLFVLWLLMILIGILVGNLVDGELSFMGSFLWVWFSFATDVVLLLVLEFFAVFGGGGYFGVLCLVDFCFFCGVDCASVCRLCYTELCFCGLLLFGCCGVFSG